MITSVGKNVWGYDPELNKIYRIKNQEKVYYVIAEALGSGCFSTVHALNPTLTVSIVVKI